MKVDDVGAFWVKREEAIELIDSLVSQIWNKFCGLLSDNEDYEKASSLLTNLYDLARLKQDLVDGNEDRIFKLFNGEVMFKYGGVETSKYIDFYKKELSKRIMEKEEEILNSFSVDNYEETDFEKLFSLLGELIQLKKVMSGMSFAVFLLKKKDPKVTVV
ncbi:MAG: hypothetical protein AB7D26_10590 [Marinobacterium sp.]